MALTVRSTARPTLGATRARQGRLGRHVLFVLLASLLLVVVGFFAAWTWRADDLARVQAKNTAQPAEVQHFAAPAPSDATRQNNGSTVPATTP